MAPSRLPLCLKGASCSSRGCAAPKDAGARLWARSRRLVQVRCAPPSHPRRPATREPRRPPQSPSREPFGTRRARWLLVPLFPRSADAAHGAADRRSTHREPRDGVHVAAALLEGGVRAFFEVLFEQLGGLLVQLGSRSWTDRKSTRLNS